MAWVIPQLPLVCVEPIERAIGLLPGVRTVSRVSWRERGVLAIAGHPRAISPGGVCAGSTVKVVHSNRVSLRTVDDVCVEIVCPTVAEDRGSAPVIAVVVVERLTVVDALESQVDTLFVDVNVCGRDD